jgi:hypothetical protein
MAPKTFAVAATVADPLTAERLVEVLQASGIDAFARSGGAASSDGFSAASPAEYPLLVPAERLDAAQKLISDELAAIERDAVANGQAAEDEALSGENPVG